MGITQVGITLHPAYQARLHLHLELVPRGETGSSGRKLLFCGLDSIYWQTPVLVLPYSLQASFIPPIQLHPGWLWLSPIRAGPQGRDEKVLAGQTITQYVRAVVF